MHNLFKNIITFFEQIVNKERNYLLIWTHLSQCTIHNAQFTMHNAQLRCRRKAPILCPFGRSRLRRLLRGALRSPLRFRLRGGGLPNSFKATKNRPCGAVWHYCFDLVINLKIISIPIVIHTMIMGVAGFFNLLSDELLSVLSVLLSAASSAAGCIAGSWSVQP